MSNPGEAETRGAVRLDRWLWAVRLFKTRSLAAAACRAGRVEVIGGTTKPSRLLRPGDELHVTKGDLVRHVRVLAPLEKRVGAKLVAEFMEDLTTDEARQLAAERRAERGVEDAPYVGEGRPTKKKRRRMDAFLEEVQRNARR